MRIWLYRCTGENPANIARAQARLFRDSDGRGLLRHLEGCELVFYAEGMGHVSDARTGARSIGALRPGDVDLLYFLPDRTERAPHLGWFINDLGRA